MSRIQHNLPLAASWLKSSAIFLTLVVIYRDSAESEFAVVLLLTILPVPVGYKLPEDRGSHNLKKQTKDTISFRT